MQDDGCHENGNDDVYADLAHQRPDTHNTQRNQNLPRSHREHIQCKADLFAEHQILRIEAETSATDGFGHAQLGGLAARLADVVKAATGAKVRPIELSLLQRCAAHCASGTDIAESFLSGKTAVEAAVAGETDQMVGFACTRDENGYRCEPKLFDLSLVANTEKKVPLEWINPQGNYVTQAFIDYCLPLIQGETGRSEEHTSELQSH